MSLGIEGLTDAVPVGRGGFSVVYKAYQADLDRWVAVKLLPLTEESSLQRFDRERKAMGRLSEHPGIVTIFDSGYTDRGEPYLTMAYHQEGSLWDRLKTSGPMEVDEAVGFIVEVAGILHFAHGHGIVHRDMKPANVLLGSDGHPLVSDFGVSGLVDRAPTASATVSGLTPAYSPPELLAGDRGGVPADIYGLGATLFTLLQGSPPFSGDTEPDGISSVIERITWEQVPNLRMRGVPERVCEVIEWSMAKAPEDRPASAQMFAAAVRAAVEDTQGPESPDSLSSGAVAVSPGSADSGDERPEPTGIPVTFGVQLEDAGSRTPLLIEMPDDTDARRFTAVVRTNTPGQFVSRRLRRLVDGVPLSDTLPALEQVWHGQRLTFGEVSPKREIDGYELVVVGGPQAGERFALKSGDNDIGRDSVADITIADRRISRRHAVLGLDGDDAWIEDVGSSNGTFIDGEPVEGRRQLAVGDVIELGGSLVSVRKTSFPEKPGSKGPWVEYNRPPRIQGQSDPVELGLEAPPDEATTTAIQWSAVLLPIVLGVGLGIMLQTWYMLSFALLSPAMILWNRFAERRSMKRLFDGGAARFESDLSELEAKLETANRDETARRHKLEPDPCTVSDSLHFRADRLWVRRPDDPDFLQVRVGWADQVSRTTVVIEPGGEEAMRRRAHERLARYSKVSSVPLSLPLQELGVVGISGGDNEVDALSRWAVMQLAGLHSPRDLAIYALVPAEASSDWDWLKWIPHTRGEQARVTMPSLAASPMQALEVVEALTATIRAREARYRSHDEPSPAPSIVALLYGSAVPDRSALADVLANGPRVNVHTIWIEESVTSLPGECKAVVEIDPASGEAGFTVTRSGQTVTASGYDGVSIDFARDGAEALAPLKDAGAVSVSGGIPDRVDLTEILGFQHATPERFLDRWNQPWPGLRAALGISSGGVFDVDLERDGPHALVGGMTNAGKSELLQTLVLGLATAHPPSRLSFLLVDYKGGTAFKDCVDLPHTVGLVTDLDSHLVRRALTSLHAEIRRRERLLRDHGAKNLGDMRRIAAEDTPPSLVIVIDEFYALATELPEFIAGMVDVASRGRALGLHLILATQRPTDSVVNENIRANSNLKVALRVGEDQDSIGIIGSPEAARISKSHPGRAYIRTGHEQLTEVQTAYVGGQTLGRPASGEVTVTPVGFDGTPETTQGAMEQQGVSDAALLVENMVSAAVQAQIPSPETPWLPPLGTRIGLEELGTVKQTDIALLGLVDLPEKQTQEPWAYRLQDDGNLLVFGAGGSGKTTLLRTLSASLAMSASPEDLHIYGLDFGSKGLSGLETLPHCGGIAYAGDNEKVLRLISTLEREVVVRKDRLADAGVSTIAELRQRSEESLARIVLLVDSYAGFTSAMQEVDHGLPIERLSRVLADGQSVGLNAVITAARRADVPGSITGLIPSRLVLRMANEDEYFSLGVAQGSLGSDTPPGRGYVDGSTEVQVAFIGDEHDASSQREALRRLGEETAERYPGEKAPPIRVLPTDLGAADVPRADSPLRPVIGLDDNEVAPVAIDLEDSGFLVVGPPRSGRTTALATIAASIREAEPDVEMHLLAPRRSALVPLDIWTDVHSGLSECESFAMKLEGELESRSFDSPTLFVVIDDGEELTDASSAAALENVVRRGRDVGIRVIGSCEVQSAHRAFGSWVSEARKHKMGLLLTPDFDVDGDIFGVRLPRTTQRQFPPGRGFLVERGGLRLVQLASTD